MYLCLYLPTASNAKLCYASGRGIQPNGIRVKENATFKVHTKGAGSAELKIQIFGPGIVVTLYEVKDVWNRFILYELIRF